MDGWIIFVSFVYELLLLPFSIITTVYSTTLERQPEICSEREKLEVANKI